MQDVTSGSGKNREKILWKNYLILIMMLLGGPEEFSRALQICRVPMDYEIIIKESGAGSAGRRPRPPSRFRHGPGNPGIVRCQEVPHEPALSADLDMAVIGKTLHLPGHGKTGNAQLAGDCLPGEARGLDQQQASCRACEGDGRGP